MDLDGDALPSAIGGNCGCKPPIGGKQIKLNNQNLN